MYSFSPQAPTPRLPPALKASQMTNSAFDALEVTASRPYLILQRASSNLLLLRLRDPYLNKV